MRLLLLVLVSLLGAAQVHAQSWTACSANVNSLMIALARPNVTCSPSGQWTITGSVSIPVGFNFFIYSDFVTVVGNYSGTVNSRTHFNLNAVNNSQTGRLDVQGILTAIGTVTFDLLDWDKTPDLVSLSIPFATYTNRMTGVSWSPSNPGLPSAFTKCWRVTGGAMAYRNTTVYMNPSLGKIPNTNCETGKADRVWVVIFIILLILWGIAFGVLAWVTCKCCKATFWTNE